MIPNLAKPFQKSASPDANRQLLFIPGIISVLKCEQDIWISQIPLLFPNALIFIPFPTYPLSLFFYFVSMPDWKLPDEIQKDGDVFIKLIHSLAGIYMCVLNFPQSFSLYFIDLPSGTSGSSPSTLNGILSPGRRGSVGPWSALSVSSIECSDIRVQIFYFANRYLLLLAIIVLYENPLFNVKFY